MKIKIIFFILFVINHYSLHSMNNIDFDPEYASSKLNNYYDLSNYLYIHVDKISTYDNLSKQSVTTWIKGNLETGNVVCLYFFVRNFLKKIGKNTILNSSNQKLFEECLTTMFICLQQTALDIVHHYYLFGDNAVFHAYEILKTKFYYLLTTHLNNGSNFSKYPKFCNICKSATLLYRQKYITLNGNFEWVKSFKWKHSGYGFSGIYGCYGICFEPEIRLKINPVTNNIFTQKKDTIFEKIATLNIFTITTLDNETCEFSDLTKNYSWTNFFELNTFPFDKIKLEEIFNDAKLYEV